MKYLKCSRCVEVRYGHDIQLVYESIRAPKLLIVSNSKEPTLLMFLFQHCSRRCKKVEHGETARWGHDELTSLVGAWKRQSGTTNNIPHGKRNLTSDVTIHGYIYLTDLQLQQRESHGQKCKTVNGSKVAEGIAMSKFGTREEDSPSSSGENENKKISFCSLLLLIPLPKATISRGGRLEEREKKERTNSGLRTMEDHIFDTHRKFERDLAGNLFSISSFSHLGANLTYLSLCLSHEELAVYVS
ncbi:unnamed protein product [Microthlaspi erraticum]|uniref:Uncharacterized protein n=1 Tax=Microthlaspi erraticum TaxID=1685480 RepID=A0A6D2HN80_9BRAS|nr:unnamed protein product [Microthlaspi erraticum]